MDTTSDEDAAARTDAPRLAAVVFTDVVGYSALMQRDEARTIATVRADFIRMREQCSTRGGECLNTMGDGMMLAFSSAVQAVAFALGVQDEFNARNAVLAPGQGLQHRIGIHLGDVFRVEGGHVAGDGVNLAARLEGRAPPGGICISQTVYDTVKGKLQFDAKFAGPQTFKNIAEPVPVWMIGPAGIPAVETKSRPPPAGRRRLLAAGSIGGALLLAGGAATYWLRRSPESAGAGADKTIAVLPFVNMSDDKDTSYFADGVHEDLLTQLALLGQLKVVSRTSVMDYRKTTKRMAQIGDELKVASLVEGSVRRAGNMVRVTAQLIDARSDKHIWAANYDRDLHDIFKVQSELATEIARALNVSLSDVEQKRLSHAPSANPQAYDLFVQHQALVRESAGTLRTVSSVKDRIDLLQKAVDIDPGFALAWARLGAEHARAKGYGQDTSVDHKPIAQRAIAKALTLAPEDPQVKIEQAEVYLHALDDQAGALRTYDQVLAQAPYNVEALFGVAGVLNELGRSAAAVKMLERAAGVDSRNVAILARLAATYGRYRHYDRVLELRKQLVEIRPADVDLRAVLEQWRYWKTGSWESYDAWRASLPKDAEKRFTRVRNMDADRAITRGDFAQVHRLIDVDSDDFRKSTANLVAVDAGDKALHALTWHAAGDSARAVSAAKEALPLLEKAITVAGEASSWEDKAFMHALLRERSQALKAFDGSIARSMKSGNQYVIELARRRSAFLRALLGEHAEAIAELRTHVRLPGFLVHDIRAALPLASVWKHPDFIALVNDPAGQAPLPLDTPLIAPTR